MWGWLYKYIFQDYSRNGSISFPLVLSGIAKAFKEDVCSHPSLLQLLFNEDKPPPDDHSLLKMTMVSVILFIHMVNFILFYFILVEYQSWPFMYLSMNTCICFLDTFQVLNYFCSHNCEGTGVEFSTVEYLSISTNDIWTFHKYKRSTIKKI